MKNQALILGLSLLITLLAASPASAVRLFNTYYLNEQDFSDNLQHELQIRKNGDVFKNITLNKRSRVQFTLTAECRASGNSGQWVALAIFVDGIALPQTSVDQAFCSSTTGVVSGGWISGAISGMVTLDPGTHEITVVADGSVLLTSYRIDDISLQIVVEKN